MFSNRLLARAYSMLHDQFEDHAHYIALEPKQCREEQIDEGVFSRSRNLLVLHFDQLVELFLFSKLHVEQEP